MKDALLRLALLKVSCAVWLVMVALEAPAALASNWQSAEQVQVRLVPERLGLLPNGVAAFALQVRLEPGWKFYWREPGASGFAPRFDWSRSRNLAGDVAIAWPLPHRVSVSGADSFVYDSEVVLPLMAQAADPARALALHLNLEYGVCKDICIPLAHELVLELPASSPQPTAFADLIQRYRTRIPKALGAAGGQVRDLRLANSATGWQLSFRLTGLGSDPSGLDAFLEGPSGFMANRPRVRADQGALAYEFDIGPPIIAARLAGQSLRATFDIRGQGFDQRFLIPKSKP